MSGTVQPPLVVAGLVKSYRRSTVLRGLDLSAMAGEAVAVVGSNGAGKSTLLGCITGDRLPNSGSIRICGWDPFSDPRAAAGCMGFVPEQPFLYPELTVGEMLRFVAEARRMKDSAAADEILRLQVLLDLAGADGALCRELSQGMGRKVGIIAALLHRPRLLILDEAFNGLDRSSSERLSGELMARRQDGAAVVLSSHDLPFLAEWCDRGVLLAPGGTSLALDDELWEQWKRAPTLDPKMPTGGA